MGHLLLDIIALNFEINIQEKKLIKFKNFK